MIRKYFFKNDNIETVNDIIKKFISNPDTRIEAENGNYIFFSKDDLKFMPSVSGCCIDFGDDSIREDLDIAESRMSFRETFLDFLKVKGVSFLTMPENELQCLFDIIKKQELDLYDLNKHDAKTVYNNITSHRTQLRGDDCRDGSYTFQRVDCKKLEDACPMFYSRMKNYCDGYFLSNDGYDKDKGDPKLELFYDDCRLGAGDIYYDYCSHHAGSCGDWKFLCDEEFSKNIFELMEQIKQFYYDKDFEAELVGKIEQENQMEQEVPDR